MEPGVRIEANGEPRAAAARAPVRSPLSREDAFVYARACLPTTTEELADYAALVRHVLADIRDLP